MKNLFLLFFLFGITTIGNAQLQWTIEPDDETWSCEGTDPDQNAEFQTWLAAFGGGEINQGSSSCGTITASHTYDPGDWVDNSPCDWEVEVEFFLDDGCTPGAPFGPFPATFFITDDIAPDPDGPSSSAPNNVTVTCEEYNSGMDEAWFIANIEFNDGTNGEVLDECASTNLTIVNDWNSTPVDLAAIDCTGANNSITINFTWEDECGNVSALYPVTFTVEDDAPPVWDSGLENSVIATVECNDVSLVTDLEAALSTFMAGLTDADVSDECTDFAGLTFTPDPVSGAITPPSPPFCDVEITITITATDLCGQTSEIDVIIELTDTQDPVWDASVPGSIIGSAIQCDGNGNNADIEAEVNDWFITLTTSDVFDDCDAALDFSIDGSPEAEMGPGICSENVQVTVVATDDCGNVDEVIVLVEVFDDIPPDLSALPTTIDMSCIENIDLEAQTEIDNLISSATVTEDCTDENDIVWVQTPSPLPGAPTQITDCLYEYVITLEAFDECGLGSGPTDITINVTDDEGPIVPEEPMDATFECADDVPPIGNFTLEDVCAGNLIATVDFDVVEIVELDCPRSGTITREWYFEDPCGNVADGYSSPHIQVITIDHPGSLVWLQEDNLPTGLALTLPATACANEFCYPDEFGVWKEDNTDEDSEEWIFHNQLQWGTDFGYDAGDDCGDPLVVQSSNPSACISPSGGTIVTIRYWVDDPCTPDPEDLVWEFDIEIECANCAGGLGVRCGECTDAGPGAQCHECDLNDVLIQSCTPPCEDPSCPVMGAPQPNPLCNGGGAPHNMSWYSFVAGAPDIVVDLETTECLGGCGGVQSGIYDECEGMCIAGQDGCGNESFAFGYNLTDLEVGSIYYIFLDGCCGSECQVDINIDVPAGYGLSDMEEVTIESECDSPIAPSYCPGQVIQLNVLHDGSSATVFPDPYSDPDQPYYPEADLCFTWSISNADLLDLSEIETINQLDNDNLPFPEITLPEVTEPVTFEFCILEVFGPCDDACDIAECASGDCCLEITVAPLPSEFCEFDVCYEDLLATGGFDPTEAFELTCPDNIAGWQGATNITLAEVEAVDTLVYTGVDPECDCLFTQKLKINPIGNIDKEDQSHQYDWFMFECQFRDQTARDMEEFTEEYIPYIWTLETGQDVEILKVWEDTNEPGCIRMFELSQQLDWETSACDSLIEINLMTVRPEATLIPGPCTSSGTEYMWQLEELDSDFREWPTITGYTFSWVDCDDFSTIYEEGDATNPHPPIQIASNEEGDYCIKVEYLWTNFDFPEGGPEFMDECITYYGPYELNSDVASPPVIEGISEFCGNDLTGKEFVITSAGANDMYTWDVAATGAVITDSNAPNNSMVTLDLTNHDFSQNIVVTGMTACGDASTEVPLTVLPVPNADFTITPEVCVGDQVTAEYTGGSPDIEQYLWDPTNGSTSTVVYGSTIPGPNTVTLVVIDANGCMSDPVSKDYLVIEPIDPPSLRCGDITSSSVQFVWDPVPGATGYDIEITGASTATETNYQDTQYSVENLNINETVTITIVSVGNAPCGNSGPTTIDCSTDDCPAPVFDFTSRNEEFCFENRATEGTIDFSDGYTIGDADGVLTWSVNPAGAYFDDNTSVFDGTGLDVGVYTISSEYSYLQSNNPPCTRPGPTFVVEIFETPASDFTLSASEVCIGDPVTVDASSILGNPSWTYTDDILLTNDELIWDTPGTKTVSVVVTSANNCTSTFQANVEVLDSLMLGAISCPESDQDFVFFDWDDVAGATGYEVTITINGDPNTTRVESPVALSEWREENLNNEDIVDISVTAIAGPGFCPTAPSTGICQAASCIPVVLGPITCIGSTLSTVSFDWDDVVGAESYVIDVVVNSVLRDDDQPSSVSELDVTGLSPDDEVTITVSVVSAVGYCDALSVDGNCIVSPCPPVTFDYNPGPYCWRAGDNAISIGMVVTDPPGGSITYDLPNFDAAGLFTPDVSDVNVTYDAIMTYTDLDGCESGHPIQIEILSQPEPRIAQARVLCVDEVGQISLRDVYDPSFDIRWEWDGGNSATGPGPHDVSFSEPGLYDVKVTVVSGVDSDGNDCAGTAEIMITVDQPLAPPVISCNADNEGVTFIWGAVENARGYDISIDNVSVASNVQETEYTQPGNPGDSFTIEVTALSDNVCPPSVATLECVVTECEPVSFSFNQPDNMCLDGSESSVQLDMTVTTTNTAAPVREEWSGQGISASGVFDPTGLAAGQYQVDYTVEYAASPDNCIFTQPVFITLYEAPLIESIRPLNPDCYQNQVGGIEIENTGGVPPYTYRVDNLEQVGNPIFVDVLAPGPYDVLVTDGNGCTAEQEVVIVAAQEPPLGIDGPLTILNSETGMYEISDFPPNIEIGSVVWDITYEYENTTRDTTIIRQGETDLDPIEILADDNLNFIDITVTVFFNDDCFKSADIRVSTVGIQKWYIPNVISANSEDERNQAWAMFVNGSGINVEAVSIYDRWGELVHVLDITDDPLVTNRKVDLSWDGVWTDTNKNVEQGAYVYVIKMNVSGREVIEAGTVTVLR